MFVVHCRLNACCRTKKLAFVTLLHGKKNPVHLHVVLAARNFGCATYYGGGPESCSSYTLVLYYLCTVRLCKNKEQIYKWEVHYFATASFLCTGSGHMTSSTSHDTFYLLGQRGFSPVERHKPVLLQPVLTINATRVHHNDNVLASCVWTGEKFLCKFCQKKLIQ